MDKDENYLFGEEFKDHIKNQVKVKSKVREPLVFLSIFIISTIQWEKKTSPD